MFMFLYVHVAENHVIYETHVIYESRGLLQMYIFLFWSTPTWIRLLIIEQGVSSGYSGDFDNFHLESDMFGMFFPLISILFSLLITYYMLLISLIYLLGISYSFNLLYPKIRNQ